jgi:outer membrane receptor protein involved in Fe transport
VESIEIMKGAGTLYGSGAAGVINITLKKAGKSNCGTAYMNIGTQTTAED